MSQRSQVANSGSSPMAACSAACAAPGTSGPSAARGTTAGSGSVHQTARVRSVRGGQVEGLLPQELAARAAGA